MLSRWAVALSLAVLVGSVTRTCRAQEPPSILGYGFEGLGTGASTGLAVGYLATGSKFESGEWKKLVYGTAIGALSGLGMGVLLGFVDASTAKGPGVGFYMLRDSNYGASVGFIVGGIVGALRWINDGTGKDLLRGLAWGTVIGAGSGFLIGILEGALRVAAGSESTETKTTRRTRPRVRLDIAFAPSSSGGIGLPYPSLSGRF